MEKIEDKMKIGSHSVCKRRLMNAGFSETQAEMACAALLNIKKDQTEETKNRDDFNLLFVDSKPSKECISRKIKIFAHEHPEWKHDKVVAAAHGYCRKKKKESYMALQVFLIIAYFDILGAASFPVLLRCTQLGITYRFLFRWLTRHCRGRS